MEDLEILRHQQQILLDRTSDAVISTDANLVIRDWNAAAEKFYGWTAKEAIGHKLNELIPFNHSDRNNATVQAAFANIENWTGEVSQTRKDGEPIRLHASVNPIKRVNGQKIGSMLVIRDITTAKSAKNDLRISEEKFDGVFQATQVAYSISYMLTGEFTEINPAFERIFGYTREEIRGKSSLDIVFWKNRKDRTRILSRFHEQGYAHEPTLELLSKSGEEIIANCYFSNIRIENEDFFIITFIDITESTRAKNELVISEEKFAKIFHSSPDIITITSLTTGKILEVNEGFEKLIGYPKEQILGKTTSEIELWKNSKDREALMELLQEKGKARNFEAAFRTKAGRLLLFSLSAELLELNNEQCILAVTRDITEKRAVENKLRGAFEEIKALKTKLESDNVYLKKEVATIQGYGEIIGTSAKLAETLKVAAQVAPTDSSVLISGETGTGKELMARAIHEQSPRKGRALVALNCAAIPINLIESELFGREKGAFTGALSRQIGRFEMADGSTLLLDEVGELSMETQAKLLRVLQEGCFERLGGMETIEADVRLIAATNRDLEIEIEEGRFREDLYYRLNVFPIHVPPLRDRAEDIPSLLWSFVSSFSEKMGKRITSISNSSIEALSSYEWPGNVRELRNVVERAMILSEGEVLHLVPPAKRAGKNRVVGSSERNDEIDSLDEVQKRHILRVLEMCRWKVSGTGGAADLLSVKPTTLGSRMRKFGISRESVVGTDTA